MLSLTTTQQSIVDSTYKKIDWLFEVKDIYGTTYHWSTKKVAVSDSQVKWHSESWMPYVRWNKEEEYTHTFAIVDFDGIDMYRNKAEMGLIAPYSLSFTVVNPGATLIPSYFNGGLVRVALRVSNGTDTDIIRRWRFRIKKTEPGYQKLVFVCEDFLQEYIRSTYPNTKLIRDLWPSSDVDTNNQVCIPVPFGTAYIPLRSAYVDNSITATGTTFSIVASSNGSRCLIRTTGRELEDFEWGRYVTVSGFTSAANNGSFLVLYASASQLEFSVSAGFVTEAAGDTVTITQGSRYYILGDTSKSYTISEVRSPRVWGRKSKWNAMSTLVAWNDSSWASGVQWEYSVTVFSQSTQVDRNSDSWRVFQPIIADADNDGVQDSCGVWRSGDIFLDVPTQFSRSDLASMTNPSDIIKYIIQDFGVLDVDGKSFASAKSTYTAWGITWNGGLWTRTPRRALLAKLLMMCNSQLIITEQVELHPFSTESQKDITTDLVLGGSFRYSDIRAEQIENGGYISYQQQGDSQDGLLKILVPASSATPDQISSEIFELPFVQDTVTAQALGRLYFQKKLMPMAMIAFTGKSKLLALNPGDVIMINDQNYGGGEVDDETGASWGPTIHGLSLANGQAFFAASGIDLSIYAGTEGSNTPYQLVLHDSAGKTAWGYIGAADAAEALGGELVTNGGFETLGGGGADVYASWTENTAPGGSIADETGADKYAGSHSAKMTCGAVALQYSEMLQAVSTTAGKLYKYSFYTKGDGTAQGHIFVYDNEHSTNITTTYLGTGVTGSVYTQVNMYFVATGNQTAFYVGSPLTANGIAYFDTVSIQEVTHVGATGVHIVSTKDGTTRNWADIETGFNYNDTSYTFEVSQRYPVLIDSMRINKDASINFSCTKFLCQLDSYTDLDPDALTPVDDDTTIMWTNTLAGPLTSQDLAKDAYHVWGKPSIVVAPNTNDGEFTDIQDALNALVQRGGSGIYIKNGYYKLTSHVVPPDRTVEIIGESRDGVIIEGPADAAAFRLYYGNRYYWNSLTLKSPQIGRNYGTLEWKSESSCLVFCQDITGINLFFENVKFDLWSPKDVLSGPPPGTTFGDILGDQGIMIYRTDSADVGNLTVKSCKFANGRVGIHLFSAGTATIIDNEFDSQWYASVQVNYSSNLIFQGNNIQNARQYGIWCEDTDYTCNVVITANIIEHNYSDNLNNCLLMGAYIISGTAIASNNTVSFKSNRTSSLLYGLTIYAPDRGVISNNNVYMYQHTNGLCSAVLLNLSSSGLVSHNAIKIDNTGATTSYGIRLNNTASRNIINNNNIDMVNNNDTGIYLDTGCDNNQGGDNITYNCATAIDNNGAGNSVTSKDIA